MRGTYDIHVRDGYVEEIVEGEVTLAGMTDLVKRVLDDPRFHPDLNGLVDFGRARLDLSFEEVAGVARLLKSDRRSSRGYWAFVVSSDLSHGVVRLFHGLSDDTIAVQIFRDRTSAEQWLRSLAPPVGARSGS